MRREGTDIIIPDCDHTQVEGLTRLAKEVENTAYALFMNGTLKLYFTTVEAAELFKQRISREFEIFVAGWKISVQPGGEGGYIASSDTVSMHAATDVSAIGALMMWHAMQEAREDSVYYLCRGAFDLFVIAWSRSEPPPVGMLCQITRDQYDKVVS
jgi:hypothetical protein